MVFLKKVSSLLSQTVIGICLILIISFLPAGAKSVIEHGPIQSLVIPDGWNKSNDDMSFIDPRQHIVVFQGPRIGTTLSFRTIRKPGRKLSDEFEALIQQQPRKLKTEEIAFITDILSMDSINHKFTDGIGSSDSNIQLQDPVIALLSGKHIVQGTYNYNFYGCSQTAAFNGAYKIFVVLADADGAGGTIEQITVKSKTQDYDEAAQQINASLAQVKWKPNVK